MDTRWDEEVAGLLTNLSTIQEGLLEVLSRKRELLLASDKEGLAAIAKREQQIISELEACGDRRKSLLQRAEQDGLPSDSLRSLTAAMPPKRGNPLSSKIRETAAQTRLLQHQSLVNWVLVQRTLVHLSQLIEIIATGGRSKPTYGKGGESDPSGSLIDQAA